MNGIEVIINIVKSTLLKYNLHIIKLLLLSLQFDNVWYTCVPYSHHYKKNMYRIVLSSIVATKYKGYWTFEIWLV